MAGKNINIAWLFCLSILLIPAFAAALMPPHVTDTIPAQGGRLEGAVLEIRGYSLEYTDLKKELRVIDLDSKKAMPIEPKLSCEWKGKGDMPGARQQYCILKVKIIGLVPGKEYELQFLDVSVKFISAPNTGNEP